MADKRTENTTEHISEHSRSPSIEDTEQLSASMVQKIIHHNGVDDVTLGKK